MYIRANTLATAIYADGDVRGGNVNKLLWSYTTLSTNTLPKAVSVNLVSIHSYIGTACVVASRSTQAGGICIGMS